MSSPKKRHQSEFAWPFLKRRTSRIGIADRSFAAAEEFTSGLLDGESTDTPAAIRKYRKAARYYERSGEYYRHGSLGLAAKTAFTFAAECWKGAGEQDEAARCSRLADAIEEVWS